MFSFFLDVKFTKIWKTSRHRLFIPMNNFVAKIFIERVCRGNEIRVTKLRNTRLFLSVDVCVCLRSKRWIKPFLIYTTDIPAEPWCSTFFVCRLLANRRPTNFFHLFPLSQLGSRVFTIILSVKWSFLHTRWLRNYFSYYSFKRSMLE